MDVDVDVSHLWSFDIHLISFSKHMNDIQKRNDVHDEERKNEMEKNDGNFIII